MAKFAIITPTYEGRDALLLRALESVRVQTCKLFEHIVVGDGPTGSIQNLCARYGVTYYELPKRTGHWGTEPRNFALSVADSEYVMFLDDDNYLLEDCIETLEENSNSKILIFKSLYFARSMGRHVVLPPIPHIEKTKIDMGNFCVKTEIAKQAKFEKDYNHDFTFISECCTKAGWDLSWTDRGSDKVTWINKVLMVYLFAPPGRSDEIMANKNIW